MNKKSTLLLIVGSLMTPAIVAAVADRLSSNDAEVATPVAAQVQAGGALATATARHTVMADSPLLVQQRQLERNLALPVIIANDSQKQAPEIRVIEIDTTQTNTVVNTEPLFQFRDLTDRSNDQIGEPGLSLADRTNQVELLRHRALADKTN